jgi:xylitol oxidase
MSESAGRNWAGNHTYRARGLTRVRSVEELQELLAGSPHVRPLGSRHSFTDLADTTDDGTVVSLQDLPRRLELDEAAGTVTIDGGSRYGNSPKP